MSYVFDPIIQLIVLTGAFVLVHVSIRSHGVRFAAHTVLFGLLTAVLVVHGIEPYSIVNMTADFPTRLFYGAAKTVWWLGGAMMLVSSVRLFLIFERRPREARLVQDLFAGIIYVGAILSVIAYVFDVPVGTLIATSGVIAVILGLALQSTLADLFSGIALNLGRPYSVGDWIVLDSGMQGRVVETNWRATHLLNGFNDLVVLPNSTLAKSQIVNLSSPDETHGVTLTLKVAAPRSPAQIQNLFQTILIGSRHILQNPQPLVTLTDMDGQSLTAELAFRVSDAGKISAAKNEIFDLTSRHLGAAGLSLASDLPLAQTLAPFSPQARRSDEHELIASMPVFSILEPTEIESIAGALVRRDLQQNATIFEQGHISPSLMLVGKGVILVERNAQSGKLELNRLSPGDFFGERGILMGAGEPGAITTLTSAVVYEVPASSLTDVMHKYPSLADAVGATLADRLENETLVEGRSVQAAHHSISIAYRIRSLFQLNQ